MSSISCVVVAVFKLLKYNEPKSEGFSKYTENKQLIIHVLSLMSINLGSTELKN